MHVQRLHPGFSTADTTYPSLASCPTRLSVRFASSAGEQITVAFDGVPEGILVADDMVGR